MSDIFICGNVVILHTHIHYLPPRREEGGGQELGEGA